MPVLTIASAICLITVSLTPPWNLFQLFQPMGGVGASKSLAKAPPAALIAAPPDTPHGAPPPGVPPDPDAPPEPAASESAPPAAAAASLAGPFQCVHPSALEESKLNSAKSSIRCGMADFLVSES